MTVGGQALGEVAVPALGAADGVRKQAVVDETDAHRELRRLADSALGSRRYSATFGRADVCTWYGVGGSPHARMSTIEQKQLAEARSRDLDGLRSSLGRDPVPERGRARSSECVRRRAPRARRRADIDGEVIVVDNGSDDGSARAGRGRRRARRPRARARLRQRLPGRLRAPPAARYILMADADLTYDFDEIPRFLAELEAGADMVIGNRMENIQPGAMPWHHRYIGNPLLSGFLNLLFHTGVDDAHCGMRAFRRDVPAAAGSAHDRHGVRLRDGDPRREGEARRSASSRSSTTRAAASRSCRASATAGATCASCWCTRPTTCSSSPAR